MQFGVTGGGGGGGGVASNGRLDHIISGSRRHNNYTLHGHSFFWLILEP